MGPVAQACCSGNTVQDSVFVIVSHFHPSLIFVGKSLVKFCDKCFLVNL
jgi:hypothetical protein